MMRGAANGEWCYDVSVTECENTYVDAAFIAAYDDIVSQQGNYTFDCSGLSRCRMASRERNGLHLCPSVWASWSRSCRNVCTSRLEAAAMVAANMGGTFERGVCRVLSDLHGSAPAAMSAAITHPLLQ
mgnify:CR=1 FL=1|eukprot:scaffold168516_cov32-Tisochrysis_lutea.AAC.1